MLNKMCGLYIIQRVCEKVVEKCPWLFGHAPDKLKTQKMCKKAVEEYGSWLLRYVPNDPRFQGIKSKKKKKKKMKCFWCIKEIPGTGVTFTRDQPGLKTIKKIQKNCF